MNMLEKSIKQVNEELEKRIQKCEMYYEVKKIEGEEVICRLKGLWSLLNNVGI